MDTNENQEESIPVRRWRFDSLDIYEVTKGELRIIKRWSSSSLYLNIWISLISFFISLWITLLTVEIKSIKIFCFFLFSCITTFILWIILIIIWIKSENEFKTTIEEIEERIKKEETGDISDTNDSIELD